MLDSRSLAVAYKTLADLQAIGKDQIEAKMAERAHRLSELIQSDVWKYDLYPILTALFDDYLHAVKMKTVDPDALKVFDEILNQIDGSIRIGAGAMDRLAAKRVKAAEMADKLKRQTAPTPLAG